MPKIILRFIAFAFAASCATFAADLDVADPDKHPYADPAGGREGHPLAGETTNEARLYDKEGRDEFQREMILGMLAKGLTPNEVAQLVSVTPAKVRAIAAKAADDGG